MCVFCVLFFFYICDYIRAYSNVRQMYVHSICVLTAYSQWNLFQNGSQKWGILSCGILTIFRLILSSGDNALDFATAFYLSLR